MLTLILNILFFFPPKSFSATFNLPGVVKWLKFNYQSEGFYVVDYRGEGWSALITALKENVNVLPPEDRASLINNVFALSRYHLASAPILFMIQEIPKIQPCIQFQR